MAAPPGPSPQVDRRTLAKATAGTLGLAVVVLVLAVLPAEYGIDPTGFGAFAGLTGMAGVGGPVGTGPAAVEDPGPEPGSPEALASFQARFPSFAGAPRRFEGYAAEGVPVAVEVPVEGANVTSVAATLSWLDDNRTATGEPTAPDLFEVVVEGPGGRRGEAVLGRNPPGGAGNATALLRWQDPPPPTLLLATDEASAQAQAAARFPLEGSAHGAWKVHVALLDAGDGPEGPAGSVLPAVGDRGNTWVLEVVVSAYVAELQPAAGLDTPRDVVRLTLETGRSLEHKFAMDQGAVLAYEWQTGGTPVYFDFHGEPADRSMRAVSHASGTADADQGQLVAPFTGTHGWYWENRSDRRVTIELRTAGAYRPG
jgi:hypothetical protein